MIVIIAFVVRTCGYLSVNGVVNMKYIKSFETNVNRYYFSEDDNEDEDFYLIVNVADTNHKEGHIYYFKDFDTFRLWCMINKDVVGIIDNYEFDEVFYLCAIRHDLHTKALSLLRDGNYSKICYEDLEDDIALNFKDLVDNDVEEFITAGYIPFFSDSLIVAWLDTCNRTIDAEPLTVIDLLLKNDDYSFRKDNKLYVYEDYDTILCYTISDVEKFILLTTKLSLLK